MTGWWVASLCPSASTTQSFQTADFPAESKQAVCAGISGCLFLSLLSLPALGHSGDSFGRLVFAAKNSVPGGWLRHLGCGEPLQLFRIESEPRHGPGS